jgi:hypothetical protein
MFAAIELGNRGPVATHEVDVIPTDRLLADKFEAAERDMTAFATRAGYEVALRMQQTARRRGSISSALAAADAEIPLLSAAGGIPIQEITNY